MIGQFPGLQNGVKAMIVIAFVVVALVVVYAILYQVRSPPLSCVM